MAYTTYLNQSNLPRGIRNNNPGNLRYTTIPWNGKIAYAQNRDWSGNPANVVKEFEQFTELRYGIRAMMRDIVNDIKKGKNTVSTLINEYAPAFENNTTAYIASVVKMIGLSLTSKIELNQENVIALCKAIVYVENGSGFASYIKDKDYQDAMAILGISLPKKKVRS